MRYLITTSHTSRYPDPVEFSRGDQVVMGRRDSEYAGWIWVVDPRGNEGWAPESYLRAETHEVGIALSDYSAAELNTSPGEIVKCLNELNGWLWVETADGKHGWIPKDTAVAA